MSVILDERLEQQQQQFEWDEMGMGRGSGGGSGGKESGWVRVGDWKGWMGNKTAETTCPGWGGGRRGRGACVDNLILMVVYSSAIVIKTGDYFN